MRKSPTALILAALIGTSALPAAAEERAWGTDDATREILEGVERLRQGMSKLMDSLPRYAPPEITEDGDIILRRLDPENGREGPDEEPPRPLPEGSGGIRI